MNADQILSEIREANLSYLMLAQSLIRSDREQALYRLGISEENAALIALLSPAVPPKQPSMPRKGLIVGLAALFGVLFAMGYVVLREFFDQSFTGERDVAEALQFKLESLPDVERAYVHVDYETSHKPEHFLKKEL